MGNYENFKAGLGMPGFVPIFIRTGTYEDRKYKGSGCTCYLKLNDMLYSII